MPGAAPPGHPRRLPATRSSHACGIPVSSVRPLVVRCGAFGDMVLLTPLLRLLQARYGRAVDVVGSGAWTPPLLQGQPSVAHVQLLASRRTPYWLSRSQQDLVRWLRGRDRGPVYFCDVTPQTRALLARGGVRDEDVVARGRDDDADGLQPWPDRWLALGMRDPAHARPTAAVDPARYRVPRIAIAEAWRSDLAGWLASRRLQGPLVLFQPGNKRTHKRGRVLTESNSKHWRPDRWCTVARAIWDERPDAQVLLCGSPREHAVLEEIRTTCGGDPRMHNLAQELPIPRLLALLEVALGMVSVDTGPAHAAAALECPLVVLFGNAPQAKWRPVGNGPIITLGGERGADSVVADLSSAEVIAAWRALEAGVR